MNRTEAKETRFERWLTDTATHLQSRAETTLLAYDDGHLGNRLVLSVTGAGGLVEIQVIRKTKGAYLCLLAEGPEGVARLEPLLAEAHRGIKRRYNMKRRFVHRLQLMAAHLRDTWEARKLSFPYERLGLLAQLLEGVEPLYGLRARFKERREGDEERLELDEARGRLARQLKRFPLLYGAKIPTGSGGRAALYYPKRGGFRARGEGLMVVAEILRQSGADPEQHALLPPAREGTAEEEDGSWADTLEIGAEVAEVAVDVGDAGSSCADVGSIDVPDCGDLGGLDCNF